MTLITGQGVVAVAGDFVMIVVRLDLVVAVQAIKCARTTRCVALRTSGIVLSGQRERMLKRSRRPRGGTVALLAVLREVQSQMIGPARIVRFMT